MTETLGLVRASWFGHAVAIAVGIIVAGGLWRWSGEVAARIVAKRTGAHSLPSHVHEQLAAHTRATRRRWM